MVLLFMSDKLGERCDPAHVALIASNSEITTLRPAGAPTVLDQPVVLTIFISVSDHQDGVVVYLAPGIIRVASGVAVDALAVRTECGIDIKGNGHGSIVPDPFLQ